jgi:hypothetical protein
MPETIHVELPKLIEAARAALHDLDVSQEIISRLDDVIDTERRSVYSTRDRLRAILRRAGISVGDSDMDVENAATRLVNEATRA